MNRDAKNCVLGLLAGFFTWLSIPSGIAFVTIIIIYEIQQKGGNNNAEKKNRCFD